MRASRFGREILMMYSVPSILLGGHSGSGARITQTRLLPAGEMRARMPVQRNCV